MCGEEIAWVRGPRGYVAVDPEPSDRGCILIAIGTKKPWGQFIASRERDQLVKFRQEDPEGRADIELWQPHKETCHGTPDPGRLLIQSEHWAVVRAIEVAEHEVTFRFAVETEIGERLIEGHVTTGYARWRTSRLRRWVDAIRGDHLRAGQPLPIDDLLHRRCLVRIGRGETVSDVICGQLRSLGSTPATVAH